MEPLITQLTVGAFLGLVAQRLGIPALAGFVLAGVLLSTVGYSNASHLTELSEFGVVLLLFTIGMHIDLRDVVRREVLLPGLLHWVIGGAVFVMLAFTLGVPIPSALVAAALLGFSSTVLAAQVLDRDHEVTAFHGRLAIGVLILQDLIAVILLVIIASEHSSASDGTGLPIFLVACGMSLFIASRAKERVLRLISFVLIAASFSALFHHIGLSAELGALSAGILARRIGGHDEIADALWGLKEYFLVGFLLQVGLYVQLSWESFFLSIPLLLILPAKAAFFFLLFKCVGLRTRTAFLTGSLLTSYSEFALIAGVVAMEAGYLDVVWLNAIMLSVVTAFILYLPISRFNHRIFSTLEPVLDSWTPVSISGSFDNLSTRLHDAEVLIVGLGRTGLAALNYAEQLQKNVVGLDADARMIRVQSNSGRNVLVGDALDPHQWSAFDLSRLSGVVVALPGADARQNAVQLIRAVGYNGRVVSFAVDEQEANELRAIGADSVSTLLTDAGERMVEQAMA